MVWLYRGIGLEEDTVTSKQYVSENAAGQFGDEKQSADVIYAASEKRIITLETRKLSGQEQNRGNMAAGTHLGTGRARRRIVQVKGGTTQNLNVRILFGKSLR